jgi:peroxiredoxin
MKKDLLLLTLALFASGLLGSNGVAQTPSSELKAGDEAPNFTLSATDGKTYTLKDLRGHWVVLAWFPKAFTAG